MSYSKVLKDLMVSYIDYVQLASSTLKEKLLLTTPDVRYELLRDVRGNIFRSSTGVSTAAFSHDLEGLQVMLDGLSPEQRFNIGKIANKTGTTPLHWAVYRTTTHCSSIEIVNCLLHTLSQQQKFRLFACKESYGGTVLHAAAGQNKADVAHLILNSCTKDQKLQLLAERNNGDRSVADLSVPILYTTIQELEETKKALTHLQTTNDVEKEKLQKTVLQVEQNMAQQTEALQDTRDELKSSQRQIDRLQEKNDEQQQVIQVMSARQAAMEQMLERLELEFRRPIVTDETGDQELEELDE